MIDTQELLRLAVSNDIIDLNDVQAKLEMKKRATIPAESRLFFHGWSLF